MQKEKLMTAEQWRRMLESHPGEQRMTRDEYEALKKKEHQNYLTKGTVAALKKIGSGIVKNAPKAAKVIKKYSKRAAEASQEPVFSERQWGGMFEQ